jgi:hypothetical protein
LTSGSSAVTSPLADRVIEMDPSEVRSCFNGARFASTTTRSQLDVSDGADEPAIVEVCIVRRLASPNIVPSARCFMLIGVDIAHPAAGHPVDG